MTTKSRTRQLTFTPEAKELLTPFRKYALEKIYEFGRRELGDTLMSARVSAYYDHYEAAPPYLLLVFVADVDRYEWTRARKAIVKAEVEEASSWTDDEKADSAGMIYFQIFPRKI